MTKELIEGARAAIDELERTCSGGAPTSEAEAVKFRTLTVAITKIALLAGTGNVVYLLRQIADQIEKPLAARAPNAN